MLIEILNKLDEISILLAREKADIFAVTETWLTGDILDSVLRMNGYFLFRRDRTAGIGGGAMAYISNKICVRIPNLLTKNAFDFEILWLLLRPCLLPRPLSIVILAIVYILSSMVQC